MHTQSDGQRNRRNGRHLLVPWTFIVLMILPPASSSQSRDSTVIGHVINPILSGFYTDPSICRVGDDYYIVNSSFAYFPGIPVFQSRDLAHWRLIGHVLDRPEQLPLDSAGVSRGIFAPAIRYFQGLFYVTCTLVDRGGNFVVTAKSAGGPWSNPVWLPQINGIDPSLFFDDDGKAYLIYNSVAPDDKPLYGGHRTIRMHEFDAQGLRVTGTERILINGGTDIRKQPVWIEAPHIFRHDGFYFLIAAEGGTADQHSEVVFKSKNVDGPYVPHEKNPILTQRHLDPRRDYPVTCAGHADFVETAGGDWWAVFLGCRPYRPYEQQFFNTGRETFLAPVRWQGGWPVINPDHETVQYSYDLPVPPPYQTGDPPYGGNFVVKEEFTSTTLGGNWVLLRTPREAWYSLTERRGYLAMRVRPETCSQPVNPSFLGWRQPHARGNASASLEFLPKSDSEKAGLLVFQNENHFYYLCKGVQESRPVVQLYKSRTGNGTNQDMELIAFQPLQESQKEGRILLKVEARGDTYAFFSATRPDDWHLLKDGLPAAFLSTKVAGGFVGCLYALYATSQGSPSRSTAYFDSYEYMGEDEVYR